MTDDSCICVRPSILIVDDSIIGRRMLKSMIKAIDCLVLEASGGYEALEIIYSKQPDLMILDLLMPDLSGAEVLSVLHDSNYMIPSIVVTADVQESTKKRCISRGAGFFMNKPPDAEELRAKIIELLNQKREKDAARR